MENDGEHISQPQYQHLWRSSNTLLASWLDFYRNYNDPEFIVELNNSRPYLEASQHLQKLELRQAELMKELDE